MLSLKKMAMGNQQSSIGIYIHWPFCKSKCPYCDFNSHVQETIAHADWAPAYHRELSYYKEMIGARHVTSVFFGGGTPSLMQADTVAQVLQSVDDLWGLPQGVEITLEANPTSIEMAKMQDFKAAGVNRVSVGVQALRDADLKFLGREHSANEAVRGLQVAAKVFDRHSFDLIYARPQQTPEQWRQELQQALSLSGGHLSLYQLTIEEGTPFYTRHQRGEFVIPNDDVAGEMYEMTQDLTAAQGLMPYEISNHARFGDESRHNLVYWRYDDYVGVGPGAHGRLTVNGQKIATRAHRAPALWLQRVQKDGHGAHHHEIIDSRKQAQEMIMMSLRLAEGMKIDKFESVTGLKISEFINQSKLTMMVEAGWITMNGNIMMATPAGRQRLNAVLAQLLA